MALTVDRLTAEHLVDPLDLNVPRPRLSWRIRDDVPNTRQVAYRIVTMDWESGRLEGTGSVDVPYLGPVTAQVRWRVQVWTANGRTVTSEEAVFEQGLAYWSGSWICRPVPADAHDAHRPATHLRTVFEDRWGAGGRGAVKGRGGPGGRADAAAIAFPPPPRAHRAPGSPRGVGPFAALLARRSQPAVTITSSIRRGESRRRRALS